MTDYDRDAYGSWKKEPFSGTKKKKTESEYFVVAHSPMQSKTIFETRLGETC